MSGSAHLDAPATGGVGESSVHAVREVAVMLSAAQVQAVVQQATGPAALGQLFATALDEPEALTSFLRTLLEDGSHSQSVLRALIILASFPADGTERELTTVAGEVGLASGTTHRYLHTWTAAGLLERDAVSRRYRRPPLATSTTTTG
jgi:hypothetical protein